MDQSIEKQHPNRSAGLTIIELLVSITVGSVVLMMLMQLVVMNVAAKRVYEYENFITNESLFISDQIRKELNLLQPHRVDIVETADSITVTFTHEYDIVIDSFGILDKSTANARSIDLVYDINAQTLSLNGALLHASKVLILPGSTINVDYFEDTDPNPLTCSDVNENGDRLICGDGIVEFNLIMAVLFNSGETGETFTFRSRIIV
jgi:hypothetical protein